MLLRKHVVLATAFVFTGIAACAAPVEGDEDADHEEEGEVSSSEDALSAGISCTERSVTGYNKGSPYGMKVVSVGGKATAKPTAHAFLKMQTAAQKAGVRLSINSGFRSNEEQQRLYNCYKTKSCNNGNLAARPGYSNHQNGRALDLATSDWSWVRSNAPKFGFRATVPSERWHWEFNGSDPGGPCSGGSSQAPTDDEDTGGTPAADQPEPAGGGCHSATLDKDVAEGTCVQSEDNELMYQCHDGKWYRGVSNGKGPYGACTSTHRL